MKLWLWLGGIVLSGLLLATGYIALALNWSYSEGERAGYIQKFSHKGWICKTYEGEIAMSAVPGSAPTIWKFTVHDEKVADQIKSLLGQSLTLHYEEHLGIPTSCYGETSYYVTAVTPQNQPVIGAQTLPAVR